VYVWLRFVSVSTPSLIPRLLKKYDIILFIIYGAHNCGSSHRCTLIGDVIIKKGAEGNVFYIIKDGTVAVTDMGAQYADHTLTVGAYFGERALLTGEPRAATITAQTSCLLMALDREAFNTLLGTCIVSSFVFHSLVLVGRLIIPVSLLFLVIIRSAT
jgi:CRP-like cAMP-binding protein